MDSTARILFEDHTSKLEFSSSPAGVQVTVYDGDDCHPVTLEMADAEKLHNFLVMTFHLYSPDPPTPMTGGDDGESGADDD